MAKSVGPLADSRNVIARNGEGEELLMNPEEYLVFQTFEGFQEMCQEYVDQAAAISVNLLHDQGLRTAPGSTIKQFNKNITEFLEKYERLDEPIELFELADWFSDTTSHYFEMAPGSATPEMITIEGKLNEYDVDDLEKQMEQKFEKFFDNFLSNFQEFKLKLTREEFSRHKDLLEWSEELKQLTNIEEKVKSFGEFFSFFDDN